MDTFGDCHARFWFDNHDRYDTIVCDETAAKVSIAIHDGLMQLAREAELWRRRGKFPPIAEAEETLRAKVTAALFKAKVDASNEAVQVRLAQAQLGLDLIAKLVVDEAGTWATDAGAGTALVWLEQWLDSGRQYTGVEITPDFSAKTRADLIAIRDFGGGDLRVLIRDHKAKRESVDPRFDNGILVRAIWAAGEIDNPRAPWFLKDRGVRVNRNVIELETVNLMHGDGPEFILRAQYTVEELLPHRARLAELMTEMDEVQQQPAADYVTASPSALCKSYCRFLHRCIPGKEFVATTCGPEALAERIGS